MTDDKANHRRGSETVTPTVLKFGRDTFRFDGQPYEPLRLRGNHLAQDKPTMWAVDAGKVCWLEDASGHLKRVDSSVLIRSLNHVQREYVHEALAR